MDIHNFRDGAQVKIDGVPAVLKEKSHGMFVAFAPGSPSPTGSFDRFAGKSFADMLLKEQQYEAIYPDGINVEFVNIAESGTLTREMLPELPSDAKAKLRPVLPPFDWWLDTTSIAVTKQLARVQPNEDKDTHIDYAAWMNVLAPK